MSWDTVPGSGVTYTYSWDTIPGTILLVTTSTAHGNTSCVVSLNALLLRTAIMYVLDVTWDRGVLHLLLDTTSGHTSVCCLCLAPGTGTLMSLLLLSNCTCVLPQHTYACSWYPVLLTLLCIYYCYYNEYIIALGGYPSHVPVDAHTGVCLHRYIMRMRWWWIYLHHIRSLMFRVSDTHNARVQYIRCIAPCPARSSIRIPLTLALSTPAEHYEHSRGILLPNQ